MWLLVDVLKVIRGGMAVGSSEISSGQNAAGNLFTCKVARFNEQDPKI